MAAPRRVGIVGTFDVANFGDLLFPLIAEHELTRRLGEVELTRYSYRELAADEWVYAVRPVQNLADDIGSLDLLIVGGGDLIRVDSDVAPGYVPTSTAIHHPTGYWLMPTVVARSAGVPVVWNAVGVVQPMPDWARELVALGAEAAIEVTVRDEASLEAIRATGAAATPRLVPDTSFGIQGLLGHNAGATAFLDELGVNGRYVVVQSSPGLAASRDEIASALAGLSESGVQILELPISPVLGDGPELLGLDDLAYRPTRWPAPLLLAELISGAEAVIAQSLHLSIVALTAGVPVFRRPAPSHSKYERLDRFEHVHTWSTRAELAELLASALGRQPDPGSQVEAQIAELSCHWDSVSAVASRPRTADSSFTRRLSAIVARNAAERNATERVAADLATEREGLATELEAVRAQLRAEHQSVTELEDALARTEHARARTQEHLEAVLATKSWRLLAPLRTARSLVGNARSAGKPRRDIGRRTPLVDEPETQPQAPEPDHMPQPARQPDGRMLVKMSLARRLRRGTRRRAVARASLHTYRELRTAAGRVRRSWATSFAAERPSPPRYEAWTRLHDATAEQLDAQRGVAASSDATTFLIILTGGEDGFAVEESLASIAAQTWRRCEAVVVAATPSPPAPVPARWVETNASRHAQAVNDVVDSSAADFVILLSPGDRLAADCLFRVALLDHRDPSLDLVYWDDDVAHPDGSRTDPRFRPEWSPEMLLGADYIGRSFAMRRSCFQAAGGLREGFGAATTWDLLLRSHLTADRAERVTRILGHVRERSDAPDADGARAVADHLQREGWPATARLEASCVRVVWDLQHPPHVTIVVPSRHNRRLLTACLESMRRTTYPSYDVVVVDNGKRTAANERWYRDAWSDLPVTVHWWEDPFNYSAVNNAGARLASGDVLVFLNDDTEILDEDWLQELVGWATRPEIAVAGVQLIGRRGELQHAGAILGLGGFADHIFQGMAPGSKTMLGPTGWYRNVLAVTGACLAIRKETFERLGGFDERFELCGSDVALGLDAHVAGLRNVCSPFGRVRHLESVSRGTDIPVMDFYTSYWRYQPWLIGGDPFFSPALSLESRTPALKPPTEPAPLERVSATLGRDLKVFRQTTAEEEATYLADLCRADDALKREIDLLHSTNAGPMRVESVNWYIPDIDSPFYGGIHTAFRIADHLARNHGVENRFVVWGTGPEPFVRSAMGAAFPSLAQCPIFFAPHDFTSDAPDIPECDVAIATLWVTAYAVAHARNARRKFYLIQDFEPMFYPAGTMYALTEETYRLGLYGLCNTENLLRIYHEDYNGTGTSFMPAVDTTLFHPPEPSRRREERAATLFVYARPGHWRNCWELTSVALEEVKRQLGSRIRILTAGSWASPGAGTGAMRHLGLLDYRATAELYRRCDLGLALTVSRHPSYLPLELMASGVPVVAFDNPWGHWILEHEHNAVLTPRTVDGLVEGLVRVANDRDLRARLSRNAAHTVQDRHADWHEALSGMYDALCDPDGTESPSVAALASHASARSRPL